MARRPKRTRTVAVKAYRRADGKMVKAHRKRVSVRR